MDTNAKSLGELMPRLCVNACATPKYFDPMMFPGSSPKYCRGAMGVRKDPQDLKAVDALNLSSTKYNQVNKGKQILKKTTE